MQDSKGAAWGNRKTREYRVWSIEYRESEKDVVSGDGHEHREFRVGISAIGSWYPGSCGRGLNG
jgi:hypothetical protein